MTGDYQLTLAQPDHFDKLYDLMVAFIKEDTPYRVVPIDRETITSTIRSRWSAYSRKLWNSWFY